MPSFIRIRILPLTMAISLLFLGVKISQIIDGRAYLHDVVVRQAVAQEEEVAEVEAADEMKPEAADTKMAAVEKEMAMNDDVADPIEDIFNKDRQFSQIELDIL